MEIFTFNKSKNTTRIFVSNSVKRISASNFSKCLFVALLLLEVGVNNSTFAQTSQTFTTSGSFTVPAGVTAVNVECWGGGGSGGGSTSNSVTGGGGGAGGSYAMKIVTVNFAGSPYTITVGATKTGTQSAGSKGNPSWFGTTSTVYAEGGNGGAAPTGWNVSGGAGSTASSIGDIVHQGGDGAGGTSSRSGGGGGGAGSNGNGGNASGTTAGTGGASYGGNGATGITNSGNGSDGNTYGGGGSGAYVGGTSNRSGGDGASGAVIVSWINVSATSTDACIGNSNTGTITVTASGGNTPYSYKLNSGTPQSGNIFSGLAAGTYTITVTDAIGRSTNTSVTVSTPALSLDDQNAAGTDSWIGHVYDGTNSGVAYNASFTNYYGNYPKAETFNETFGGPTTCFDFTSNSIVRSIYTETFSVRYRMNSTKKGLWIVDMGSDDGNRLTVDGTLVYDDFTNHAVNNNLRVLMSLTGSSSLTYDYYEDGGGNTVYYQNLVQILANTLSANTTQTINIGNSGAAISGDVYGALPTGITLSGTTGYQWVYSTTPGDPTTLISGATAATFTPNTSTAPFNTPGVYYVYRNALLNSANNKGKISPYLVTNTSNAATITISLPTVTTSVNTLTGFSYSIGNGPSAEQSFTLNAAGLTAPVIVKPPLDFEVSVLSGGIFYSSGSSPTNTITLTPTAGVVSATINVRLKAGNTSGTYGPENIDLSSTGFATKSVICVGAVIPNISAGGGGSYCSTESINLTSNATGFTNIYWEGPNNFYFPNNVNATQPPTLTTNMIGDYTVTASYVVGNNLVVNGDFESSGTQPVGFTSFYTYVDPSVGNTALVPEKTYTVVADPKSVHNSFSSCPDHTIRGSTPTGKQMVVNGAGVAGQTIWSETVPVVANSSYQFTYWVQTVCLPSPSQLQLYVNGRPAGPIYIAYNGTCHWVQFLYNWNSDGGETQAILSLVNFNTDLNGNDFALDDIVFHQVIPASAKTNVSVIITAVPATVTVTASANPVNLGTSVTFTAAPYNGGNAPTYKWFVGGTQIAGATSTTFSYVPVNGDVVKCTMISNSNCISDHVSTVSSSVTMTVNARNNYWKGTNSTNWGTTSNWTANIVPGTGDDVVFSTPSTSGEPINNLILDVERTIGNLENKSTKQLIISPARCLTVNGTITTNGASSPGSIYIQAYPDGTQQNGSMIFPKATNVYGTVEMYSKATYDLGRAVNDQYRWQYFGIPVMPIPANPTFNGSYVRSWYEPGTNMTNHWKQLTSDSIVRPFYGYEITQPTANKFIFQGQLVNWDWTSPKPLVKTGGAAFPGQYIFANPYAAAIDIRKIIYGKNDGVDMYKGIYLYTTGTYLDWQNGGIGNAGRWDTSTPSTVGNLGVATQVPSMQAFLVQVNTSTPDAYITIPYSAVVRNSELQRVKGTNDSTSEKVCTRIEVAGNQSYDKMWIFSDPGCTRNYDNGWDGFKMLGSALSAQLYAKEKDGEYQIDAVDNMNGTVIGFQPGVDLEYTFTFTHQNTSSRYAGIYLYDEVGNKTIDITESGTQYKFVADANETNQDRFKIITRNFDQNSTDGNSKIKIFNSGGIFFVQNLSDENGEFRLFDMAGRAVCISKFGPNSVTEVTRISQQGIYIGKAVISSDKVSNRFIVQ